MHFSVLFACFVFLFSTPLMANAGFSSGFDKFRPINLSGKYVRFKLNDRYGYVDLQGNIAIEPIYDQLSSFYQDKAFARSGNTYGFIAESTLDFEALELGLPKDDDLEIVYLSRHNLFNVTTSSGAGLMKPDGEWLIQPTYDYLTLSKHSSEVVMARQEDELVFLDKNGKGLLSDFKRKQLISPEFALVSNDKTGWKLSDLEGNILSDTKYKVVIPLEEKRFYFRKGRGEVDGLENGLMTIDKTGTNEYMSAVVDIPYKNIFHENRIFTCIDRRISRSEEEKAAHDPDYQGGCGYADPSGKWVTSINYSTGSNFDGGLALACGKRLKPKYFFCDWIRHDGSVLNTRIAGEERLYIVNQLANRHGALMRDKNGTLYSYSPDEKLTRLVFGKKVGGDGKNRPQSKLTELEMYLFFASGFNQIFDGDFREFIQLVLNQDKAGLLNRVKPEFRDLVKESLEKK